MTENKITEVCIEEELIETDNSLENFTIDLNGFSEEEKQKILETDPIFFERERSYLTEN